MFLSLIIPVFNRPEEIREFLKSVVALTYEKRFEILIIEDGSTQRCDSVVALFNEKLNINYYYKENSGPGDSRNFGMNLASGDYFLIFDSDCILPTNYLLEVEKELDENYVDCFGGPDAALDSFSEVQKAINFAMTSFISTGGIRGGSEKIDRFQPRSFNMGISRKAFQISGGFGNIHPGEDPDLSIRLWNLGFETRLFSAAYVYHKRRIDWQKFSMQVNKFGKARPILNHWYPKYRKLTFFIPSLFLIGLIISATLFILGYQIYLLLYLFYFFIVFLVATIKNKSYTIGALSVVAVFKQFYGYGTGFITSFYKIQILKQKPQDAFPELFFKK